jgi:hypothetical protein
MGNSNHIPSKSIAEGKKITSVFTRIGGESIQTVPITLRENSTLDCSDLLRLRGKHELLSTDCSAKES